MGAPHRRERIDRAIESEGVRIVIGRHYHKDGPYMGKPDLRAHKRRIWVRALQGLLLREEESVSTRIGNCTVFSAGDNGMRVSVATPTHAAGFAVMDEGEARQLHHDLGLAITRAWPPPLAELADEMVCRYADALSRQDKRLTPGQYQILRELFEELIARVATPEALRAEGWEKP